MHLIIQSSGLVLSVSSSIPQELSLILSLEIVGIEELVFQSDVFFLRMCTV